jgi:hypothetical protein
MKNLKKFESKSLKNIENVKGGNNGETPTIPNNWLPITVTTLNLAP